MSGANPIASENARPGTADWRLDRPATSRQVEAYAGAASVARGEPVAFFVSTPAARVVVEVFRIGWYGGLGARRVAGPVEFAGIAQPMPAMDPVTGLVDCDWRRPVTIATADAEGPWPSGVYLARFTEAATRTQSYAIVVVRDDARHDGLLVQLPFSTYQAYNPWGGKTLYHWGSSEGRRAAAVSFNRPFAANPQNPAAACGMGAGEFIANLQPDPSRYRVSNAGWDVNMVRFLEREGVDVHYATSLDTHARVPRAQGWLSIGHDEYWSAAMRDHAEAARDAGVHLGFFSANSAYWQVRFEPSPATGEANRVMVCHKKAKKDPLAAREPGSRLLTDKWRSGAVGRPEEALIGVMYAGDPVDADIVVTRADHWVFAGTGLAAGDRLRGLLGYEVDRVHDPAISRATVLAASPWVALTDPALAGVSHMAVSTAASGATVFATGTIQWAWGLDDFNVPALRDSRLSPAAQRITRNVLARFLG